MKTETYLIAAVVLVAAIGLGVYARGWSDANGHTTAS